MGNATVELCEHGEIEVACLDCFAKPKKLAPQQQATKRTTKTPTSGNDPISPLSGALDLSVPVDDFAAVVGSATLTARTYPHHLRRSGWVYLRTTEALEARVKVKKVVWSAGRTRIFGDEEPGAGMVLEFDPSTWDDSFSHELGRLASQQAQGYRYLASHDDGTVTHYVGGKPVVFDEEDEDD